MNKIKCYNHECKEEAKHKAEFREDGNVQVRNVCPMHLTVIKLFCDENWLVCKFELIHTDHLTEEELMIRKIIMDNAIVRYREVQQHLKNK